jgi:hypothetical protein
MMMKPRVRDIAAPPFDPATAWIGAPPPEMERLTAAGPVLVHFFDFAQLNSVRALPYVLAWAERYGDAGLAVLGVHSPRYPFSAGEAAVAGAMPRLGIEHPVAVDSSYTIWHDYGCQGWPSLFVWGAGGALRWFHFGEGEYRASEEAIQGLLGESRPGFEPPDPMPPLRPTDAPDALVAPPSEEVFPGGSASEPWTARDPDAPLELSYEAGGAYAAVDGRGSIQAELDGKAPVTIAIERPGLVELASHPAHESHRLTLRASDGVRIWSVAFAAGVP